MGGSALTRCVVLASLALLGACATGSPGWAPPSREPSASAATASPSGTSPPPATQPSSGGAPQRSPARGGLRGIDVSHHQGTIDWRRVAGDGIDFAYLKATEGSSWTDPAFGTNWAAAADAGLRVGGYHYYTLCSPPEPQAEHFVSTLGAQAADLDVAQALPPAVDIELIGNCDPPPPRGQLIREVREFRHAVHEHTGTRPVIYVYPDAEDALHLRRPLGGRQWIRQIGERPPEQHWFIWQRRDDASIDGVTGPVDLNQLR